MSRLSPLLSRLLALTLLLAVGTAIAVFVVSPYQQRAAELDDTIASSEALLARLSQMPGDPKALMQQRDALSRIKPQSTALLRGDNEPIAGAFVQSFLTNAIEGRGGTIRSIQVLPVHAEHGLRRVSARAQLRITSTGLRDLLHRIEGAQPYLFVDNLDIRQNQAPGRQGAEHQEIPLLVRLDVYGYLAAAPVAEERS